MGKAIYTETKDPSPIIGIIDRLQGPFVAAQRRRQIGIRRALGATRLAILRLFQRENLLIALSGVLAGTLLATALNIWLIGRFEMVRLDPAYGIGSALGMLMLGQIAVFWPAMRASQVPPALAVRA